MAERAGAGPAADVAIVGMAAVLPGAADLDAYWRNLEAGVDAIADVPAARWDPVYYDPDAAAVDRFYCRRGGFVDDVAGFDPIAYGIMPVAAAGAEPDQLLALHVAARALDDAAAGRGRALAHDKTGVILGRGGYLTSGIARLSHRVRTAQQIVTTLAELVPDLDAATLDRVRAAFQDRAGQLGPETVIGLVPNLAASRIANRLDLRGPAYTVDAACASALVAVDQACRELALGRCDVVLAGGVHLCHDVTFWSVFTQLGALSRSQAVRPFDRRADGILIGEGAGVVVLRRRADAERDGDRIYAVIRGTGVSSDGRASSPMRPRVDGQVAALEEAWRAAGADPAEIGLVEAHGTGTPTGDEAELETLRRFFGEPGAGPRAGLGSVKSMIGHAMPAAGAAGLIKAALALHHGVLPPSLHCDEPHDAVERTRFRVVGAAEPWDELPRRAAVNAFGFGGINAHVVLDAPEGPAPRRGRGVRAAAEPVPQVLALAASSIDALRALLDAPGAAGPPRGDGPVRLALVDPTAERRALAAKVLDRGRPWRGNRDLWFTPRGLAADGGKVAFLYPGIEVGFAHDAAGIARLGGVRVPPPLASALPAEGPTRDLERQGLGVYALGRLVEGALARLGAVPDVIAGHSIGEWTGMVASELIPPADADAFVAGLRPGSLEVPDVVFAAVGCGAAGAAAAIEGLDEIAVSHDNCPHQSIVCGRAASVRAALERLAARGVLCQELPFRSGFHSPLLADYLEPHRRHLRSLPLARPKVPLWSATTCAPYPADPEAVRALAIDHLVRPVRFRELIEALYRDGVRAFVQVGVGSLASFVGDTLRGDDHVAIAAASPQPGSGARQLARVAAALWTEGWDVDVELGRGAGAEAREAPRRPAARLDLGAPLVRLGGAVPPIALGLGAAAAGASTDAAAGAGGPVLAELARTLREAADASQAVVDAWTRQRAIAPAAAAPALGAPAPAPAAAHTTRLTLSTAAVPALLDHCFYRQPPGWPHVADRYPVVPMTMNIELMLDAARRLRPGRVAIAVEDVRAYRWLAVAPPVDVELVARATGPDTVDVDLPGYARATVRLAAAYPPAPAPSLPPLAAPRPTPVDAARLYADRWMFHGPAYAGVVAMGPMGDDGVDGEIEVLPAPGALLDCSGQLMGWWVMDRESLDRLAMPVRIARIQLFGDHPAPGARVGCRVRFRDVAAREVTADHELTVDGRLWAKIDGWQDRRFDSDEPLWAVLQYPEHNALAEVRDGGWAVVTEHWRTAASRELVMRRYLTERERAAFEALDARRRRAWLLGRIALKDAVRRHLWAAGAGPLFPVEVEVAGRPGTRPTVTAPGAGPLRVSLAHTADRAVALVRAGAGPGVGVDVEPIAPRAASFTAVAFTDAELALGAGRPADEWMTRLWTAKEAAAKARGTGLGDPRRTPVRAADGDRLDVDGVIVETRRDGDLVVAWTLDEAAATP